MGIDLCNLCFLPVLKKPYVPSVKAKLLRGFSRPLPVALPNPPADVHLQGEGFSIDGVRSWLLWPMRILGIDYGKVRIGLSMSDPMGVTAQPLTILINKPDITSKIKEIALQHSVKKIVVGLPLNMNGSQGEMASAAQHLASKLRNETGLPVEMMDERLTSWEAEEVLKEAGLKRRKRKEVSDKVAATLILQRYLESKRRDNSS